MKLIDILNENMKKQYTIYCDMDGVLKHFDARFEHFTGLVPNEYTKQMTQKYGEAKSKEMFWDLIDNQVGVRFWRGMEWMPDGKALWSYIKQYKPILLTAPSYHESSKTGKTLWVQDHIGDTQIVFEQAEDKCKHAKPNHILIDDREDTIMRWKEKNGIGILHKSADETIRELKKIGL